MSDALRHGSCQQIIPKQLTMQSSFSNRCKFSGLATLIALTVFSIVSIIRSRGATFTPGRFLNESVFGWFYIYHAELQAKAPIRDIRRVGVWIDNSQHYPMRGGTADEEWKALAPPVGDDGEFSSIAMIHQLQCLAVIRQEYLYHATPEMAQHCMEYIHQSILCTADTRLETVGFSKPPHVIGLPGEYVCRDWSALLPGHAWDGHFDFYVYLGYKVLPDWSTLNWVWQIPESWEYSNPWFSVRTPEAPACCPESMLSQRGSALILFLNIAFIIFRISLCVFGKVKYSMLHRKSFSFLASQITYRLHWKRLSCEAACAVEPSTNHIRLLSSLCPRHSHCRRDLEQVYWHPQWRLRSSRTRSPCLCSLDVPRAALHIGY